MKYITDKELLEETIKYYITDQNLLSKKGTACSYFNEKIEVMCAVGRCLEDAQELQKHLDGLKGDENYSDVCHLDQFKLKEQYKNIEDTTFENLQILHDEDIIIVDGVNTITLEKLNYYTNLIS